MNDMQMSVLNMLQKAAAAKPGTSQETTSKDKTAGGFRDMMDKAEKQTVTKDAEQPVEKQEDAPETMPNQPALDMYTLQELAAMQLFCADTTQNVVVQDAQAEQPQMMEAVFAAQTAPAPVVEEAVQTQPEMKEMTDQLAGKNLEQKQEAPVETAAPEVKETAPQHNELEEVTVKQVQHGDDTVQRETKPQEKLPEEAPEGAESKVFSQVEAAPIKVSEAAAEPEQPKSVEAQVTRGLKEALTKGETKVELQLTPEHLGKITIELTKQENGALHVVLHAENSHTKTLLERDMVNMQHLLSRDTQQDVQIEVRSQQETQQKEFYDGHQRQDQQQQQEQHHQQQKSGGDFLNQLRLGLIPENEEAI